MRPIVCCLLLYLLPLAASAGDFSGEAGLGALITSGNSETRSLNGKFVLDYRNGPWQNNFAGSAIAAADNVGTTTERYTLTDKLDFDFTERDYIFGSADFEKDLFAGIRQRASETIGYGRHALTGPVHRLDIEVGGGARQTEERGTGIKEQEFIGRAAANYQWTISPTSSFLQTLKIEAGASNTFTESVSELKLSIIGNLLASISFTARNNSDVPEETEPNDSFTALNLTYVFGKK